MSARTLELNAAANTESFTQDELNLLKRVVDIKIKMLMDHPFFGILLQNVRFGVSPTVATACTDGEFVLYGQKFCSALTDEGLYFVTFHELMHVVLGHCFRGEGTHPFWFNVATDIVVNSQIFHELKITEMDLGLGGTVMHLTPDGREGRDFTAEEVYDMLVNERDKIGERALLHKLGLDKNQNEGKEGAESEHEAHGQNTKTGETNASQEGEEEDSYAVDENGLPIFKDDHTAWGKSEKADLLEQQWKIRIRSAAETVQKMHEGWGNGKGMMERLLEDIKNPPLDWRTILHNFIQEEINDYSFNPPDRRFQDSPFFLPDFNEKDEAPKNVWVLIDASGSVNNRQLGMAFNEIVSAVEQFEGRLEGKLSFFDVDVSEPQPFSSVQDLLKVKPVGNGGTSFTAIFDYYKKEVKFDVSCIIIITDGYSSYPNESAALGTPVLWLLNNKTVTPPWGEIARMRKNA